MRLTYSVKEAAKVLGVAQSTVYERVKEGRLPHVRLGGRILLPKKAIRAYLDGAMEGWREDVEA